MMRSCSVVPKIRRLGPPSVGPSAGVQGVDFIDNMRRVIDELVINNSQFTLERGLISRKLQVQIKPTLIVDAPYAKSFILLNPNARVTSTGAGSIAAGALIGSAARTVDGNTQSAPLNVSDYRDCHLFVDVTAVSGSGASMDIISQAYDPIGLEWYDIQLVVSSITNTGRYYVETGSAGLATGLALRWVITGTTPSFTFSISYVLKDSLPGLDGDFDLGRTLYIGSPNVTITSGYPLLTGQTKTFFLRENVKLYGIAVIPLDIAIFDIS